MSVQASKVFPKSSRTDRQRASTDRDFAGNSKEDSKAFIGLKPDEILALGIARGNLVSLSIDLITL